MVGENSSAQRQSLLQTLFLSQQTESTRSTEGNEIEPMIILYVNTQRKKSSFLVSYIADNGRFQESNDRQS